MLTFLFVFGWFIMLGFVLSFLVMGIVQFLELFVEIDMFVGILIAVPILILFSMYTVKAMGILNGL